MSDKDTAIEEALAAVVDDKPKGKPGRKPQVPESVPENTSDDEVVPLFETAARAHCTCGEKMARKAKSDGVWSCLRVLTGNSPTKVCQKGIKAELILAVLPPPKKEE